MTRELLLLRHAKSAWDTDAATDFDRPLTQRGRQAAPQMGHWMHHRGLRPDHVVSSPAKRALQTAEKICVELQVDQGAIHWEPRIYEANVHTLLKVLAECPAKARRVLLVGHNPGLETLLLYLCPDTPLPDDAKLLPTATLAHIELPDDWSELTVDSGRLLEIQRPRQPDD